MGDTEEVGQGEVQIVPNQQPDIEDKIMAEIDNVNIPDIVSRPVAQNVPKVNMTGLQVPPVLNEPIPMKPVKKTTPVINYDQILTPVNIDVTLKGQLPPFDMIWRRVLKPYKLQLISTQIWRAYSERINFCLSHAQRLVCL